LLELLESNGESVKRNAKDASQYAYVSVLRRRRLDTRATPYFPYSLTPWNVSDLDRDDNDLGSRGVLLLPAHLALGNLAAVAGKTGRMFVLDQGNLGGHVQGDTGAIDAVDIGAWWCGPSYFNDGTPHIVTGGGNTVNLWNFKKAPQLHLVKSASSTTINSGQDSGFFTSISSSGSSDAIIWAVSRPSGDNSDVTLFAFKATPSGGSQTLDLLFQATAGSWPYLGNANIVPTIANGRVYVASYGELDVFGLPSAVGAKKRAQTLEKVPVPRSEPKLKAGEHDIYGVVLSTEGTNISIRTRVDKILKLDVAAAIKMHLCAPIVVGRAIEAHGTYDAKGVMHANTILRAKDSTLAWLPDR
jgi:hypothetical protein